MPKIPRNIKDTSLKNLEVLDNDATVYSDPSRKGFLVEINSQGRIIFSYEYKFNKNIRQIPLGTHPSVSLEKARSKWLESSKKVLDGKDIWLYDNVEALEENKPKEAEEVTRILSESEILLFWKKIDSINRLSAITKLALKLILLTGIKKEDLLLATWDDINIKKRSWALHSKKEIFLNSLSVELLLEIQDFEHHTAYSNTALKQAIIASNNKVINLSPGTLDRALNDKGCQRLGINPFTPNDLAETHTTLIEENEKMIATFGEDKKEYIAEYIKSLVGN
ncbi:integrase family protein [Gammaproteobacteria bacterium]|nr:integrase family protein [Gammaproteobacteria bacterium]MDC0169363.1 integrase family protein [bacterium]|tara:strand:- start:405 stop:1244 length:840 start_codon:yes stop_codon:yes gene_type:complete